MKYFHKISDLASYWLGTPQSMIAHFIWWGLWFALGIEAFPYNFLTMLLSLEAIIMCILILNSDTRQGEKDRKMVKSDLDVDNKTHEVVVKIWEKLNDN